MPFPASNGTTFPLTLDVVWTRARDTASQIQATVTNLAAQIATGTVSAQALLNAQSYFVNLNNQLTSYAAVPGLAVYAQQQVNNPSLDVAAAFTAMQNALVAVGTWVVNNFPVDSSGFLQAIKFNAGQIQWVTFTSAQVAGLSTLLTALSATIG